jgi:hypothetical protein
MKNLILSLSSLIQSAVLYLINLFLIRRLKIRTLDVQFEMVHGKLRAFIFWDVQGCHRIKIKAYSLALPGNIKGVSLKSTRDIQSVKIQFLGLFNKVECIVPIHEYPGLTQPFFAFPTNFSVFLDPDKLEVKSGGLFTLASEYGSIKLSNKFSSESIHTDFADTSIHTEISPSPAEFFTDSQNEQTYFQ